MNPLALISAFIIPTTLIFGLYILYLDHKNPINRLFFVMMILIGYWNCIGLGIFYIENKETCTFWFKMSSIYLFIAPISLNIVMLIVRLKRKIMIPVLSILYLLYIFFIYKNINLSLVYKDFIKINGYWNLIRVDAGLISILYIFSFLFIFFIATILLIKWHRITNFEREKRQSLILFSSMGLLFLFLFIDFVIYRFFTDRDLGISIHYQFVWPIGIGIAIMKHGFLSLSPGLYSQDVFENIEESILLIYHDKKIAMANTSAKKIFGDIGDADLRDIISGYDEITGNIDSLLKGNLNNFTASVPCAGIGGANLLMEMRFSVITDMYKDRVGVLIIGRELKGVNEFISEYNLTHREFDVIRFVPTGHTNNEIAERLNICERTIKSHLLNIYGKLNIKNKVELMNVLKRYGLE